jgi:hypothetical protein
MGMWQIGAEFGPNPAPEAAEIQQRNSLFATPNGVILLAEHRRD